LPTVENVNLVVLLAELANRLHSGWSGRVVEPLLQQLLQSELCSEPGHQRRLASLQVGPLRTGLPAVFIADPDPAFYFNEDSDPDPAFHFSADSDPDSAPIIVMGICKSLVYRLSMAPF
jgi:hypothetical protein